MAYDPTDDLNRIPAPGSSSESDADLAQIPAPTAAPEPPKQTFGDLGKRFAAGLADTFLTAPGAITESLGGSGIARRSGQELSKRITDTLSPQAQALDQNALFGEDWSVHPQWGQKIAAGVAQSAPSLIQAFALGRQLQAPLTQAGVAEKVAAGMGRIGVPAGAAKYVGQAVEALPFSAIEGAASGGQSAADVIRQVEEAPIEQLMTVPRFNELFAATNPALSPEERAAAVRAQMAVEAGRSVGAKTGLWTGAVGAVTEGGVLGPIARRLSGKGVGEGFFREAIKGGLHEAGQEAPQSAGEQYLSNVGRRDYVDPTQDPWQNVWQAGAEGGVIGFALGGGADAATYRPRPRDEQPHGAAPPGTAPVAPPGAPPVNPPVGPNAGPISRAVQVGQQSGAIPTNAIGGPVDTPGNEEVTQPPGSMSKSLLGVAPSEASSDEKTSALSAIADIAAKVPADAPLALDSPAAQAMAGAIERATAAGATQEDLLSAASGRVPPPDIQSSPKEDKAATKELDAAIDRVGKLTEKIARANAAADKARERGDEETAGNAESLAATLRDRLETARGQLETLQGAQRAGTGSGPVPGTDVGTGVLPADGRPRGGGDQPGRADAGGSVAAAGVPAGRPAGEGAGLATAAVPPADGGGARPVVLQNRDRSSAASVAQMASIAGNPDPRRLSFSRDFGTGAPVVFANADAAAIPETQLGAEGEVVDAAGKTIPVRYAVVEAAEVVASNRADGTPNDLYADADTPGLIRAVAGNGRMAGLQEAFNRGTAAGYVEGIAADARLHGVDPEVIRGMQNPVLVRVMRSDDVTPDIGDRSNVSGISQLDPVEQARTDVARVNLDGLEFGEDGGPAVEAVRRFIRAMPDSEQSGLMDQSGAPGRQAVDRLMAAAFAKAYESDDLVRLYAQATDPEARNVISALAQAAGPMARLAGAGDLDIRPAVIEAAQSAVNASRRGVSLSKFSQQRDFDVTPEAWRVVEHFVANARSAKRMAEGLRSLAEAAYSEAQKGDVDMFGTVPKRTGSQIINEAFDGQQREGDANADAIAGRPRLDEEGAGGPGGRQDERTPANDPGQPQDADRPADGQAGDFDLVAPTREDILRQQEAAERAAQGEQTEDEAQARLDAEREAADQVGFLRPPPSGAEQRDTSGDMFGGPTADDVLAQRERERRNAPEAGGMFAAPVDAAAAQAATSPKNDTPEPTEAQKDAGNYKKGHVRVAGLDITIENEAGTHRRPEWPALPAHYGYLKRTEGADGDQVDVFVKPGAPEDFAGDVFVIDQMVGGKFDEHKVMLGYPNQPAAAKAYRDAYTKDWKGMGAIRRMSMDEFKAWLRDGETTAPAAADFTLAGSDRPADQAAARGQMELAPAPQPEAASASKEAGATAPKRKGTKAQREAEAAEAARADYFTPGNILRGYGGFDRVLEYKAPEKPGGAWSVKVESVRKNGDAWVAEGRPQDARWHSTQPDARELAKGPVERGKAATQDLAEASAKRTRPKGRIEFASPVVGPSGAKLTGYQWVWQYEESVDERGEDRVRRISDWDKAELNEQTNRMVVHQFGVEMPDGTGQVVSAETALQLLGFTDIQGKSQFKSVESAAKTLARTQMVLTGAELESARWKADWGAVQKMTPPQPESDSQRPTPGGRGLWWSMGDASIRQIIDGPLTQSTREGLVSQWRDNRMVEKGWKPGDGQKLADTVSDLKKRIKVAEKRIQAITKAASTEHDIPAFETYDDALDWVDKQAEPFASRKQFEATNLYRAAYPQIKTLYDRTQARSAAAQMQTMTDAGIKVGDRVQFTVPGFLLAAGRTYTGTVIDSGGRPVVKIDGRMEFASRGGRTESRTQVAWDSRWTKAAPANERGPSQSDLLTDATEFIVELNASQNPARTADEAYQRYRNNNAVSISRGEPVLDERSFRDAWEQLHTAKTKAAAQAEKSDARITRDSDLADGTTIYDEQGRPYRVHYQRNDVVVAHPIVDGKAQVSADTSVRFWVNPDRPASGENDRTDPIYTAPQGTLVSRANAALKGKNGAAAIARDIAKERPFDDAMQVRAAAREAIREQLGQKALDDMGQGSMMTSDELTQAVHDGQYEGISAIGRAMPVPVTESQIGTELSDRAFAGTSHSPERRGQSARREYVIRMVGAWLEAKRAAGDDQQALARITDEFEKLRDGYLSRYRAYLGAHSNVQSSMIAGPARFPVERNRKRSEAADKRAEDANEFLRKGIERLKKAARAPVDQSPTSEVERIRKSLAERERAQEQMKAVNAALRKGDDAVLREMGFTDEAIAQFKKPDFAGRTGFPSYRLTNNQAEIRRLRERLEQAKGRVEAAAEGPASEVVNGVRIEEDAQANRIRLIFEGKPDEATRTALKAAGFRWAPSVGAWQRQLTGNARAAARSILNRAGDTAFSRSGGTGTGLPVTEVTRIADAVRAAWANGPEVVVVEGMTDPRIPSAVRAEDARQRSGGAAGAPEGFFADGRVYLVASELASEADVVRVLAHEALGHYGLRGLYGERLGKILDQIANVRRGEIAAKVKEYGLPDTKAGRRVAAEELLAGMAQTNPQMGFVKKAIAAIRQWLRELGFRFAVTDADIIAQFILPARAFVESGARGSVDGVAFQRVWHGTPHKVERFSTDAVGTGEGNQAYGWGLYFSSLRGIAEYYRDKLSRRGGYPEFSKDGKTLTAAWEVAQAYFKPGRVVRGHSGKDVVLAFERDPGGYAWNVKVQAADKDGKPIAGERQRWHSTFPDFAELEQTLAAEGYAVKRGNLYEAEIPEDDELLLWDKPLAEQPEKVKAALRKWKDAPDEEVWGTGYWTGGRMYESNVDVRVSFDGMARTEAKRDVSLGLLKAGVRGIKYLDGGSRADGRGTFNYVVFSDNDIEITAAFSRRRDVTPLGFYSELERQIGAINAKAQPAQSWIQQIDALTKKGVKPDEIEWSGVKEWLALQDSAGAPSEIASPATDEERSLYAHERCHALTAAMLNVAPGAEAVTITLDGQPDEIVHSAIRLPNTNIYLDAEAAYIGKEALLKAAAAYADGRKVVASGIAPEALRRLVPGDKRRAVSQAESLAKRLLRWSDGISGFNAKRQPNKITKDAILEYLAGNGVRVEEVMLGERRNPTWRDYSRALVATGLNHDEANRLAQAIERGDADAAEEAEGYGVDVSEVFGDDGSDATKFADYRVPGAAENYRELLLTLPEPPKKTVFTLYEGGNYFGQYATRKEAEAAKVSERRPTAMVTEIRAPEDGSVFRSGHWDQPNVLAHIRFDERTDADGKRVLFINEIQSDWAQVARKTGFKSKGKIEVRRAENFGADDRDRYSVLVDGRIVGSVRAQTEAEALEIARARPDLRPPLAPFVGKTEAWVALALKRMIRYAVDSGFDRVALVNGEQAANMFDLSHHIERLYYTKNNDGTYTLSAESGYGEVFRERQRFPEAALEDVVGKEIAQRIIDGRGSLDEDSGSHVLEGIDLKVGGEGMRGFYDRIVPTVLKDVLKKVGGGAVTRTFNTGAATAAEIGNFLESVGQAPDRGEAVGINLAFDITPAMRDTVLDQGLAMFSRRPSAGDVQRVANQAARAIRGATVKGTWRRMVNAWTDKKPLALQLLGRRQIVDVYGNLLPHLGRYSDEMQQYDADKNESAAVADELVNRWRKLADADALADLMHDATLAQFDPDIEQAGDADQQALKDRFDGLSAEAKSVYREARGAYAAHWNKVKAAIRARIERADLGENERRMMMEQFRDQFLQPIQGVYFPLARWGDYVITAKDADGQRVVVFAESLTEAQAEHARMERELTDVSKITLRREYNAARDAVSKEFVRKLFETVDETSADMAEADLLKDAINQLYLTSLPDVSWAKHGIHRKGTPGYSRDARRAFAMNMFHGGYYLSKLRHADVLQDYLRAMQEHIEAQREDAGYDSITAQQVVNEMVKRHDLVMNPDNSVIANTLTGMGFVWFLGLSPASAIVNLSQTALVAYPIMAARFGYGKAADALTRASKEAVQFRNDLRGRYGAEENAAIDRAVREGLIDITQAHDLAGVSEGRDNQLLGALSPVMRAASYLFHQAEKFNRQATFIAAYRLARQAGEGAEQAYDTARDLTYKGHFDYACVDAETECLTLDGWKRYNELREGDVAIAVDANGLAVESRVSAVNVHRGAIPVTKFQSRQFSMVLTDNHDAVVQTYNSRDRKWQAIRKVRADSLKPSQHILRAPSAAIVRTAPKYGEDFAALLGWVAAEGWYAKYRKSKVAHDVRLAQSLSHNPEYVDEIRGILDRLGGEYKEYVSEKRQMVFFVLRRSLGVRVQAAMPDKLLTAAMLRDMPAGEMGALVDAFLKGDGSNRGRGDWSVGQKDGQNLDVIQAMAVMLGMRASQSPVDKQGRGMLHLGRPEAGHRSHVRPMSKERAVVDMVWCPTTEHGTWVARRGGRVFVTGNSSNRPRVMMGPVARVLLLFKQYGQNMIYTLGRNALLWAKGDREAKRALSGILVAHGLTAGMLGLPFAPVLLGLASIIGGSDDEPWDAEVALRNYLADSFLGKTGGEMLARGVFRGFFPGDISGRVGLDSLLIRDIDLTLEPNQVWREILEAALGPVIGIGVNASRGAADLARGDLMLGIQGMLPKAIADGVKTIRYATEGVKDRTGIEVLDEVTARDLIAQTLGFSPGRVREAYDARRAVYGQQRKLDDRRDELLSAFSKSVIAQDHETRLKTLQEIQHFNQVNPTLAITPQSMLHSIQNRMRRQAQAKDGIYLPRKQRDLAELGRFANTR